MSPVDWPFPVDVEGGTALRQRRQWRPLSKPRLGSSVRNDRPRQRFPRDPRSSHRDLLSPALHTRLGRVDTLVVQYVLPSATTRKSPCRSRSRSSRRSRTCCRGRREREARQPDAAQRDAVRAGERVQVARAAGKVRAVGHGVRALPAVDQEGRSRQGFQRVARSRGDRGEGAVVSLDSTPVKVTLVSTRPSLRPVALAPLLCHQMSRALYNVYSGCD